MDDLKKNFDKEPVGVKVVLVAAVAGVVASFLPWWSIGGLWGASVNGWHGYGFLTSISSVLIVLMWLLPKVGVKFSLPWNEKSLFKILSVAMLAGPVLWLFSYYQQMSGVPSYLGFSFSFVGLGVYLALGAGGAATYYSFAKLK